MKLLLTDSLIVRTFITHAEAENVVRVQKSDFNMHPSLLSKYHLK